MQRPALRGCLIFTGIFALRGFHNQTARRKPGRTKNAQSEIADGLPGALQWGCKALAAAGGGVDKGRRAGMAQTRRRRGQAGTLAGD